MPAQREGVAWRDLQGMLRDGLLGEEDAALLDLVAGDGLDPRARLAVYRHHVLTTLTAVLEAAFPVVCRLVDRRFFGYAADAFIRSHPPTSPCLAEYGAAFPAFLAGFDACASLPYLPDVARLEWAIHVASEAPPAGDLDLESVRRVDPADMAGLRFSPRPGLAFVASPWPVDRIWEAHQGEDVGPLPDLDAGAVRLEIGPTTGGVRIRTLRDGAHAFRRTLAGGGTLGDATDAGFARDPSLDLAAELHAALGAELFTDFTLTTTGGG